MLRRWALSGWILLSLAGGQVALAADSRTPVQGSPYLVGAPRPNASKAPPDTFALYGGPGSLLGKFQTAQLQPDAQGWTPVDPTQEPPYWRATLYNSPTGTLAYWCGATAVEEPGWVAAPGYGNAWHKAIEFRAEVSDPAQGQTVDLSFVLNYETETSFDNIYVEYQSGSSWNSVALITGNNRTTFQGPFVPVQYPDDFPAAQPIVYAGNDYGGDGDEIVLRIRFASDGARSDQDALWPTDGALQIDEILVQHDDGSALEDFEGGEPFAWTPMSLEAYAGNFAHVMSEVLTHDPCADNPTPVLGFVDDGTGPYNPNYEGPGTGGSYSSTCEHVPDCSVPVFNYTGGLLSPWDANLSNEWWSPPIEWDLPGPADDDPAVRGCLLRFSVWRNLPLQNWIFYDWKLRSRDSMGSWTPWISSQFGYYNNEPDWYEFSVDLSEILPSDFDALQIALRGRQWNIQGAEDGTQAPLFDNVRVLKYTLRGPLLRADWRDLARDAFPESASTDVSTQMARDLLDVRIDSHRDLLSSGNSAAFGDSIVVEAHSLIPGTQPLDENSQIRLYYSLNMNPLFEPAIRANAPVTGSGSGLNGWDQHEGHIDAERAAMRSRPFGPIELKPNFFAFDLPDQDFMYPGDRLEYYIEVVDDLGNSSTLPAELTGYDDPSTPYLRRFTMLALPSFSPADGSRPSILIWNTDVYPPSADAVLPHALGEAGLQSGVHYDWYFGGQFGVKAYDTSLLAQLDGYDCIIIESDDLKLSIMSGADFNDATVGDIGLLRAWRATEGADRAIVHFGDNLGSWLEARPSGQIYLSEITGISVQDDDLDGVYSFPTEATGNVAGFNQAYITYGSCPKLRSFDSIQPIPGAVNSHSFDLLNPSAPSAGVYYATVDGSGGEKKSLFFPYGLSAIRSPANKLDPGNPTLRSIVLEEIFAALGQMHSPPPSEPIAAPALRHFELHAAEPNPFNPSTTLSFTLGRPGRGSVKIYNARGELVRVLAIQRFDAGLQRLVWQGRDENGSSVASGVYHVQYEIDGYSSRQKIALVK